MPRRVLFVTGKLAERALRKQLRDSAPTDDFAYEVAVLPITVVALATVEWISRHLAVPADCTHIVLPGLCAGELALLTASTGLPVERGPKDLRDLPEYFGKKRGRPTELGKYDIEILAEINHADRLSSTDLLQQAEQLRADGADLIDLGCSPGVRWSKVGAAVRLLRAEKFRVSIDSFDPVEVTDAVEAGAELVLSVNSSNIEHARGWHCPVVVVPDLPTDGLAGDGLASFERNIETLLAQGKEVVLDPILEPIGFGFAASLGRYAASRQRYPQAEMLMGIGNLTELTEVDSAGVNVLLLGYCQELGIRKVLTTQVANWCRSSVREVSLGRQLVHYACTQRVMPKYLAPELVQLRDARLRAFGPEMLAELAKQITDRNFRILVEAGQVHVLNNEIHLVGSDAFALWTQLQGQANLSPGHAFYLGYELAKACTALTLGKNYQQDQALRWGLLTVEERSQLGHRE